MNKVYIVIIIILLLLLGAGYFILRQEQSRFADNLRIESEKAKIWKDKYDHSHAEIENLQLTNKELRQSKPALIDSIKKHFTGIKPKTITNVVTITKTTRDTIKFPVSNPLAFNYHDKWTDIKVNPDSTLTYATRDSLALVSSTKKYGLLNLRRKQTVEVVSFNPHTDLTGVKSIVIRERPKRVGIGIALGYGATKDGIGPALIVGLQYRLFP